MFERIERRGVEVTVDVSHRPADRLRIRKGQVIRLHNVLDGDPVDFRVTKVSMPDASGRCVVSGEPVQ